MALLDSKPQVDEYLSEFVDLSMWIWSTFVGTWKEHVDRLPEIVKIFTDQGWRPMKVIRKCAPYNMKHSYLCIWESQNCVPSNACAALFHNNKWYVIDCCSKLTHQDSNTPLLRESDSKGPSFRRGMTILQSPTGLDVQRLVDIYKQ